MSAPQIPQFANIQSRIQQVLSYWQLRIQTIRSQWLGRLGGLGAGGGGTTALGGLLQNIRASPQPTVRRVPARTTAQVRVTPVAPVRVVSPPPAPARSAVVGIPGEKYDFSYSKRVGVPGEKYDFSY